MNNEISFFFFKEDKDFKKIFLEHLAQMNLDFGHRFKQTSKEKFAENQNTLMIAHGGDGSFNQAIQWLADREALGKVPILYHPSGTGNDFARTVGLEPENIQQSLSLLKEYQPQPLNLGKLNQECFINMGTFGEFARITPSVDPGLKKTLGQWSYYLKALQNLTNLQPWNCEFKIDDQEPLKEKIFGFFVGNCRYTGGGIQVSPDQSPTEDNFDLLIVNEMPLEQLLSLGLEMQKESPNTDSYDVVRKKIKKLEFSSPGSIPITLDGEMKEMAKGIVEPHPQQVRVLIPQS